MVFLYSTILFQKQFYRKGFLIILIVVSLVTEMSKLKVTNWAQRLTSCRISITNFFVLTYSAEYFMMTPLSTTNMKNPSEYCFNLNFSWITLAVWIACWRLGFASQSYDKDITIVTDFSVSSTYWWSLKNLYSIQCFSFHLCLSVAIVKILIKFLIPPTF